MVNWNIECNRKTNQQLPVCILVLSVITTNRNLLHDLFFFCILRWTGGVATSRVENDFDDSRNDNHTQLSHRIKSRGQSTMGADHSAGAGKRSWRLHVSNKHRPDEVSSCLFGCCRYVVNFCSTIILSYRVWTESRLTFSNQTRSILIFICVICNRSINDGQAHAPSRLRNESNRNSASLVWFRIKTKIK